MSGFKYRGANRTMEDQRAAAASSGYDSIFRSDVKMFKPREGENCIRVLPDTWPDDMVERWGSYWSIKVFLHRNVGPEGGTYLCLEKMKGEPCPVEAAILEARQNDDEDTADALRRQEGRVVWLIDRENEKEGPQVWLMPKKKVFDEIVIRAEDKKTKKPLKIDDPDYGYDITFNRVGTGQRTDYKGIEIARDPSPIHDDVKIQDRWIDYTVANTLPDILNYYTAEHIERVLSGGQRRKPEDKAQERSRRGAESDREPERSERERPTERPRTRTRAVEEEREPERASGRARPPMESEEKPWDDPKEQSNGDSSPSEQARSRLEKLRESRAAARR